MDVRRTCGGGHLAAHLDSVPPQIQGRAAEGSPAPGRHRRRNIRSRRWLRRRDMKLRGKEQEVNQDKDINKLIT